MNIENAKKLVGQLERLPDEKFDISTIISHRECSTVACVAGWAMLLNGGDPEEEYPLDWAQRWLGFSYEERQRLFLGRFSRDLEKFWFQVTRSNAIDELNRMIAEAEAAP